METNFWEFCPTQLELYQKQQFKYRELGYYFTCTDSFFFFFFSYLFSHFQYESMSLNQDKIITDFQYETACGFPLFDPPSLSHSAPVLW